MSTNKSKICVIIGGAGYIGQNFAKYLIEKKLFQKIYLLDLKETNVNLRFIPKDYLLEGIIEYKQYDIREKINFRPERPIDLVCNFAAVHREPGHEDYEYFDTNIKGANNTCEWSDSVGCKKILFTSSISPYGEINREKDENSIIYPNTPYGISKAIAEKIHEKWQARNKENQLYIVRPGVVYGPYESGNLSRMIKAIKNNYFFYSDNKKIKKSAIYIEELCSFMEWIISHKKNYILANASIYPPPSVEEIAVKIMSVLGKEKIILNLPLSLLTSIAFIIDLFLTPFKKDHPFKVRRVQKIKVSNNVIAKFAIKNGYKYKFDLEKSFIGWRKKAENDW